MQPDDRPSSASTGAADEPIRQHSAGGVVVRRDEVLLISTRDGTRWQLPKGRIEGIETPAQAAAREVEEETGVLGYVLEFIESIDFRYNRRSGRRVQKTIDLFLLGYRSGSEQDYDPKEVTEARWFLWDEAIDRLTFDNERSVVIKARDVWHRVTRPRPSDG